MRRGNLASLVAVALVFAAESILAAPTSDGLIVPAGVKARRAVPLPSGEAIELTLHQTVVLTLQNVLDLDVAAYNLDASGSGIQTAKGAFDPSLELGLGAADAPGAKASRLKATERTANADISLGGLLPLGTTYRLEWKNKRVDEALPDATTLNPSYASGLTARLTQPLLRNYGATVNERFVVQAKLTRDMSGWDFVRAVQMAIQLAQYAYWDLVYAVENLRARKEALARAEDLNRITKIRIDVGALASIDVVQTEVTIAQREQDIIAAEGLVGDAHDRLRRLLNVQSQPDWSRPIIPTDRPARDSLRDGFRADVEAGFGRALEIRPEVRQALASIESKRVAHAYARNQIRPSLDLSASYGFSGLGAQAVLENSDGTPAQLNDSDALQQIAHGTFPNRAADLVFSVPIGNNVARGNLAIATAELELSRTNLAITTANLQVEVRAAARAIDTATRSVAASAKARELAERNLDAERKKYENGMTTSFQVAQVQNDLTAARTSELQAIATYLKSVVGWHRAVGDILEVEGVFIEGLPVVMAALPGHE